MKQGFSFSKEILGSCTEVDTSISRYNPDTLWRKDLSGKKRKEIVGILRKYADRYVFRRNHVSNLGIRCESYWRLRRLEWARDYPGQLWGDFDVVDIRRENGELSISMESEYESVDPIVHLGEPVELGKFSKMLSGLFSRITRKTVGKETRI